MQLTNINSVSQITPVRSLPWHTAEHVTAKKINALRWNTVQDAVRCRPVLAVRGVVEDYLRPYHRKPKQLTRN